MHSFTLVIDVSDREFAEIADAVATLPLEPFVWSTWDQCFAEFEFEAADFQATVEEAIRQLEEVGVSVLRVEPTSDLRNQIAHANHRLTKRVANR